MKKLVTRLVLTCSLLAAAVWARADVVNVYTGANFAPLMLADGRGLYPDLVAYLNRQKVGGHTFVLRFIPRKRLQVKLEEGSLDGLVIGMMPEWLDDPQQNKYLWTAPFDSDRIALLSLAARPVNPRSPRTLHGASVGLTAGYVYPGLESWLAKSGLKPSAGMGDEKNIEKLLLGRVDCVLVGEAIARYYIKTHKLHHKLRLHALPGPASERRFMAQRGQQAVYEQLAPAIARLRTDPGWQRIAAAYE